MIYKTRQNRNILIVEANEANARTFLEFFAKVGIHADLADNFTSGIDFFDKNKYDLVFACDNLRPRADLDEKEEACFELLEYIRNYRPQLPVVLISSGVDRNQQKLTDTTVRAVRAGFCNVLATPISKEKLAAILDTFMPDHSVQGCAAIEEGGNLFTIVGKSRCLLQTINLARRIAPSIGAGAHKRRKRDGQRTDFISDPSPKQQV